MNKFKIYSGIIVLSLAVMQTPMWRGQYKVWSAPPMVAADINNAKVSNLEQVNILLEYEHKICAAITPCLDQTRTHQGEAIAQVCEQSAAKLAQITLPEQLPTNVVKNLQIYQESSLNTSLMLAERWKQFSSQTTGGSHWTFLKRWEIDTCSYNSLPQRVRRLYQLDKLANSKIVNCKEIDSLYQSRFPASK